ncbi:MAG: DUF3427 domain-containing protein [Fusobacteriaceae bacterium]
MNNTENYSLINNKNEGNMFNELSRELNSCKSFIFNVAFINFSGLQLLLDDLDIVEKKGIRGKIITSTYLNFTEPKALHRIKKFKNIETRVFVTEKNLGFHSKCYIFEYDEYYKIYIGSSNITQSALKSNIEWNVWIESKKNSSFSTKILQEFTLLWNSNNLALNDESFISQYEEYLSKFSNQNEYKESFNPNKSITPNYMQEKALEGLKRIRKNNENSALVIASTGSGKTYMSAFDVKEKSPNSVLFLVHREDILKQAYSTFLDVLPHLKSKMGYFTGSKKDDDKAYLFSTLQTLNNHYEKFSSNHFEYIIIDEAHHATSPSYQKLIKHFKPAFLLGMTATPERTDGGNIFEIFNNNVALDLRLRDALEHELVVPFHYYGISDIEEINLKNISLDNTVEIAKALKINKRVDYIIDKMNFYGHDGSKTKCIAFCITLDHAQYMCDEFNKRGIVSAILAGCDSVDKRNEYINRLEDIHDKLSVIFTVDIFNEGVDIPSINLVLMLRPTNSPIVFIQQLGRGLRKHPSKDFLTVLDFIGNHNRAFLIALALSGNRYYDKDSIKISVENNFSDIPGCVHIKMDQISKERILSQIENENFNSFKYLKEEYCEFKRINENKIPLMCDYLKFDGAPNPLKFIKESKYYLDFLRKIELSIKDNITQENILIYDEVGKFLRIISKFLPLKRIHEYIILKLLLQKKSLTLEEIEFELNKEIAFFDKSTLFHSIRLLQWDFMSEKEKINKSSAPFPILKFDFHSNTISRSDEFSSILKSDFYNIFIKDVINYGILKYKEDFGDIYYGYPHLKLYETYQQYDIAQLSNYDKSLSAFRGSGVLKNGDHYFLFVTLNKELWQKGIEHDNVFFNNKTLSFFSKSTTSSDSDSGQDLVNNKNRGKNLHIFVRKFSEVDKIIQPFIYLGLANCISFQGNKPIKMILELEKEISSTVWREFI